MFRGIIFDCDGTLVDSRARMVPFYNGLFAHFGLPLLDPDDPETVAACVSLADADIFARFILDPQRRTAVAGYADSLSHEDLTADLTLMPHALETLRALRPDFRLAIATNRGDDMAAVNRRLGLDRYVDVIVTAAEVPLPKPAPDTLLLAARRLGLVPDELLYVGDTEVDREAALAAGIGFLLYCPAGRDGHPGDPALNPPQPATGDPQGYCCLTDLADLVALLAPITPRHEGRDDSSDPVLLPPRRRTC